MSFSNKQLEHIKTDIGKFHLNVDPVLCICIQT